MPELEALVNLTQNKYHKDDAFKHTLEVVKNVPPRLLVRLAALFHDIGKAKTKTDSVIVCENCGEKVYVWSEKQSEAVCKHCKHLNKFTSIDELKKKIISYEVRFFEHEEVGAKIAEEIMRRLKYPADVIDAVVAQVKFHMRLKNSGDKAKISDKALRKLKIEIKDHLEDLLDLMHSDNIAHSEESSMPNQIPLIKKRFSTLKLVPAKQHVELPINGNDLLSLGIPRGKRIGELLKFVEDAIMENPDLTRDEALKIVKSHL
jgi:tRNA nucleotidyltransferase (CCA-adding enzyme)